MKATTDFFFNWIYPQVLSKWSLNWSGNDTVSPRGIKVTVYLYLAKQLNHSAVENLHGMMG